MKEQPTQLDQLKILINEYNRLKDLVARVSASKIVSDKGTAELLTRQLREVSERIDALTKGC